MKSPSLSDIFGIGICTTVSATLAASANGVDELGSDIHGAVEF